MRLLDPSPASGALTDTPRHRLQNPAFADRVVVIEPMGVGGISHYTYCLCQALEAEGSRTTLITARNYELVDRPRNFRLYTILREWFRPVDPPGGHRVVRQARPSEVLRRRLEVAQTMVRIVTIVLRERASIVHLQWPVGPHDWLYLMALRLLRRRVVYTAHDIVPHEHAAADVPRLRRLLRCVDRVIVHCRENDIAFRRIFPDVPLGLDVIPHGNYFFFDPEVSLSQTQARAAVGVPLSSPVVLFFGTIRAYKGLKDLVAAFARVRERIPTAWLVIAGYPFEDFAPYEQAIADANVRECAAIHLGYHPMPDVAKFFRAADVVVLPYRSASQSGIAHLAFAFGVPVVATRVGGLPELIEHGHTGLLVSSGDQQGLAEAIIRLLTHPSLCRSIGARAADQAATRYSWRRVAALTREVYSVANADRSMKRLVPG